MTPKRLMTPTARRAVGSFGEPAAEGGLLYCLPFGRNAPPPWLCEREDPNGQLS